jgi:hypothetical protein
VCLASSLLLLLPLVVEQLRQRCLAAAQLGPLPAAAAHAAAVPAAQAAAAAAAEAAEYRLLASA